MKLANLTNKRVASLQLLKSLIALGRGPDLDDSVSHPAKGGNREVMVLKVDYCKLVLESFLVYTP